jgi:gamma-glutamyltranspeptidase/glutathione hydrolase
MKGFLLSTGILSKGCRCTFWAVALWGLCFQVCAQHPKVKHPAAIATSHPLATQAGAAILRAGGSAVDAAIAAQMVLTLVEPQSSGIGGGALALHHDGHRLQAYDGRETAPADATERLFIKPTGEAMSFTEAVNGGLAVGTPGVVRVLGLMHERHGRLPWKVLLKDAIDLASKGFPVSQRLHAYLKEYPVLKQDHWARALYLDAQGHPWPIGHLLQNPELKEVLEQLAEQGPQSFYEGELAQAMVNAVQHHPLNPGRLKLSDLLTYQALERDPLCVGHQAPKKSVQVCGFPPPSSGGIAIAQILGILSYTPYLALLSRDASLTALKNEALQQEWIHGYTEAARLAFADRAVYVADPGFVAPPAGSWLSLTDSGYLKDRASIIRNESTRSAPAGTPSGTRTIWGSMPPQTEAGTSHMSIADGYGASLALTTTIESIFGARIMVNRGKGLKGGFFLNNQLTDFSFLPQDAQGRPIANRVGPGKRPRSSMSPTLVLNKPGGELVMNLGSSGGAHIIHYTAKTLLGLLHEGLEPQEAVNTPNISTLNGPTLLEKGRFDAAFREKLKQRGAEVIELNLNSGTQALVRKADGIWSGGADLRREGSVEVLIDVPPR